MPDQNVLQAIRQERELLSEIRDLADHVIDTSEHTVHSLRDVIKDHFAEQRDAHELNVTISSFGFRHGAPRGLDMMFDVRFLPNPHFVAELRPLTGRDSPVNNVAFTVERPLTTVPSAAKLSPALTSSTIPGSSASVGTSRIPASSTTRADTGANACSNSDASAAMR